MGFEDALGGSGDCEGWVGRWLVVVVVVVVKVGDVPRQSESGGREERECQECGRRHVLLLCGVVKGAYGGPRSS